MNESHYYDAGGFHRHKCPDCGCVWNHPDGSDGDHECPKCFAYMTVKYYGPKAPDVQWRRPQCD